MSYSRQLKLVPALLLSIFLVFFIVGCNSSSKKIGINGGEVTSNDGLLKLIIPAGALLNDTEITLESFTPDIEFQGEGLKRFYKANPDGLTFFTPAILEADVSEFYDSQELPILLSASITEGAEVLANQEINTDFENATSTISGEVDHFSTFSVIRSEFTVEIRGVPLSSPANSPIDSIHLFTSIKEGSSLFGGDIRTTSSINELSYFDFSTPPVVFEEATNPVNILEELGREAIFAPIINTPDFNNDVNFPLDYRCGDPNFGEFKAVISLAGSVETRYRTTEDVFAFVPGFVGEATVYTTQERPFQQTFLGRRPINCAGIDPTDPIEEPTDPIEEPQVATLTIDQDEVSFVHVIGVSPCPQPIKTVTITNTGTASTDVSLSSSTIALSADTASFTLVPGESKEVIVSFTCNPPESFVGTIEFKGNNTSTTLTANGVIQ